MFADKDDRPAGVFMEDPNCLPFDRNCYRGGDVRTNFAECREYKIRERLNSVRENDREAFKMRARRTIGFIGSNLGEPLKRNVSQPDE
jgi:hypothetical protein